MSAPTAKGRRRRVLAKITLLVGSVGMMLGVAEIAVRVLGLAPRAPAGGGSVEGIVKFDPTLETRYQPSAHTRISSQYKEFAIDYDINELGLRDRPVPPRSGDAAPRLLALGNSFVEGWGVPVEESFLRVAEDRLSAKTPVRIVNGGASGYGAAQSYLLGKELVPKVQPDAVVFFYVPTMVQADSVFLAKAKPDQDQLAEGLDLDLVIDAPSAKPEAPSGNSLAHSQTLKAAAEYSHLVRLVRTRLANRAARQSVVPGDPKSDLFAAYRAPEETLPDLYAPTLRHVVALGRLARGAGLPFVVVQLPMPFEVSAQEWARGREIYGLRGDVAVPAAVRRVPAEVLGREGIPLVAAHEFLAEKAQQHPPIYYAFDFHLNPDGQRFLGEWLAGQLAALGLPTRGKGNSP